MRSPFVFAILEEHCRPIIDRSPLRIFYGVTLFPIKIFPSTAASDVPSFTVIIGVFILVFPS